jgi:hypothetical protein
MSLVLTGGVALAYAAGVVGLHRYTVFRRRQQALGFPTLAWRDWDALLEGVTPAFGGAPSRPRAPPDGGPVPHALCRSPTPQERSQYELLCELVDGAAPTDPARWSGAGFSGGEARWLTTVARAQFQPEDVLLELEDQQSASVAEATLQLALAFEHRVGLLNLELFVFGVKLKISRWLKRFGDHPALFFQRARASALLGLNTQVLDDLARAVYFSRESQFYLLAVNGLSFVEDARPALAKACRQGLARRGEPG